MKRRITVSVKRTIVAAGAALGLGAWIGTARSGAAALSRRPWIVERDRQPSWWLNAETRVEPAVHALEAGRTIPNEVIVQVKPGVSPVALARRFGLGIKRAPRLPNTVVLSAPNGGDARTLLRSLAQNPMVEYATANAPVRMMAVPNDSLFNEQWGHRLVKLPEAWDIQKGAVDTINPGVTVAVLDSGVNFQHPDLQGRIAGGGFDFWNNDSDPSDDNGHGSHVAGIIAAGTDNGRGVAGVTWQDVKILPVKILDRNGDGTVDSVAAGIRFAADKGARIINLSVGTLDDSPTMRSAVQYALNASQKPILVCAAGNYSDRRLRPPALGGVVYPANYPDARVIAVGAVGPDGQISYYSSENPAGSGSSQGGVDIVAPGGNSRFAGDFAQMIVSTSFDSTRAESYAYAEGTSQAAPFVAGTAALLLAEGVRTTDVENVLYSTATRGGTARTEALGWGIVNAQAALQSLAASLRIVWPTPDFPVETESLMILTRLTNTSANNLRVTVDGRAVSGGASTQAESGAVDVVQHTSLSTGSHVVVASVTSSLTGRTRTASASFRVTPKVLPAGFYMFSVPYTLPSSSASPTAMFGRNAFSMARYAPEDQQYALFDSSGQLSDSRAGFNPPRTGLADNPAGLGYWVRLLQPVTLVVNGDPVLDAEYRIPVSHGWAMIGDPFVFPVSLGAARVESGSTSLTMAEAVNAGWLRPEVYRYDPSINNYQTVATTSALLRPWEGLWVQTNRDIVIVVPGVQ